MNHFYYLSSLLLIFLLYSGCTSKIDRNVILMPEESYISSSLDKGNFLVINSTGSNGIITTGGGPKLEETYLVPDLSTAIKNKLQNCIHSKQQIKKIYILDAKFQYANMFTIGSCHFLLKLQVEYDIDGKLNYVIYQANYSENNQPIGFKGIDVEDKTNYYFNKALNQICLEINEDNK